MKATQYHTYLQNAYRYFNSHLFTPIFGHPVPEAILTLTSKKSAKGYYHHKRFNASGDRISEISICYNNLAYTTFDILSTLAHEMAHYEDFTVNYRPNKGRNGYHDKQWASIMRQIGLIPYCVDNGAKPGKETGFKVTHTIEEHGKFAVVATQFLSMYGDFPLAQNREVVIGQVKKKKTRPVAKCDCGTSFSLPYGLNITITCNKCGKSMI